MRSDRNSKNEVWDAERTGHLELIALECHMHPIQRGVIWMFSFPEELYGDFEDLETGDVHKGKSGLDTQV